MQTSIKSSVCQYIQSFKEFIVTRQLRIHEKKSLYFSLKMTWFLSLNLYLHVTDLAPPVISMQVYV